MPKEVPDSQKQKTDLILSKMTTHKMNKLEEHLNILAAKIANQEAYNDKVSKSNVGWHIEHILLTISLVIESVKKSNPKHYKWSFKLPRILVLYMKKIPRGRAKSPQVVVPKTYSEESLKERLEYAKLLIQELQNINPVQYFNHPFFGNLKLNKTITFLEIHTEHHLKIINDILENK